MPKSKYFYDDFSTSIATSGKWYTTNVATGVVNNGLLRIKPTATYDYVGSSLSYDLTDSYIGFKLAQNCILGVGTNTITLTARTDSLNLVEFDISGGRTLANGATITMREKSAGSNSDTNFVYDPAVHVWFRIREEAGTLYWETSTDAVTWTVQRSKATTLDLTAIEVLMSGGYWGAEAGTTFATVDDFNLWAGNPGIPKAGELTDNFSTLSAAKWYQPDPAWTVSGNTLQLVPSTAYSYIISTDTMDLNDSYYGFQLVQNANSGTTLYGGSITFDFRARVDNDNYVSFLLSGGEYANCIVRECVAGVFSDTTFGYNAQKDRWFRIRKSGTTLYWETSFDGVTWGIKRLKTAALDLSSTKVQINAGYWDTAETNVGTVVIANFNRFNLDRLKEVGWYHGAICIGGGIDGGTVQARNYFQEADWLWDPIPDNPVLDPDSEIIGGYLSSPGGDNGIAWCWYSNALVHPSQIVPSTPRYRVNILVDILHPDWFLDATIFDNYDVPIPYGTQIPPGSDGHLTVADPVTGKVFSFWQTFYNIETDEWTATYGSISDISGDGRDYIGSATATNISRYAGVARLNEIEAGEVPHALFVASNMCRPGPNWVDPSSSGGTPPFKYPAQKSDGRNIASVPVQYTVVEGARLQLNPAIDLDAIPGITQIELTMGRAWQRYGAYVGDQGGKPSPPTVGAGQIELWQGQDYSTLVEEVDVPAVPPVLAAQGVGWDYFRLGNIPWSGNIRVLKNWDGSA